MTEIRRYSIGARGEKIFHENGTHISYEDHVKALRKINEMLSQIEFDKRKAPTADDFWAKLGGDRKTL